MSIIKSRQIYVGGYDREYYVDEMANSHLINSIRQIYQNLQALKYVGATRSRGGIAKAQVCLLKDLKALSDELDSRTDVEEC